jgi:hypothetical protein
MKPRVTSKRNPPQRQADDFLRPPVEFFPVTVQPQPLRGCGGVPTSGGRDLAFPQSAGVFVTGFLGLALLKSGFWIL